MRTSKIFSLPDPGELARFIGANPLAQVVSWTGDAVEATPLPLVARTSAEGAVTSLIGHFALANPQVELVRRNPLSLLIFYGAHGYVSPS